MPAVGSAATLIAYGLIVLGWRSLDLSFNFVCFVAGGTTVLASALQVIDHLFFALSYENIFQKIADPQDIAPTAVVGFTINHISVVFLAAVFGYIWLFFPAWVFFSAAIMVAISL